MCGSPRMLMLCEDHGILADRNSSLQSPLREHLMSHKHIGYHADKLPLEDQVTLFHL